jgi:hypothetical protein
LLIKDKQFVLYFGMPLKTEELNDSLNFWYYVDNLKIFVFNHNQKMSGLSQRKIPYNVQRGPPSTEQMTGSL